MTPNKSSRASSSWAGKPPPTRGPKPSLSRVQIARAAIHLADKEGLAAVTMQRVAREVGRTTMALYRYFPSKAAVIALMIDSVADSSVHFAKPSLLWSTRLKDWAHRAKRTRVDGSGAGDVSGIWLGAEEATPCVFRSHRPYPRSCYFSAAKKEQCYWEEMDARTDAINAAGIGPVPDSAECSSFGTIR